MGEPPRKFVTVSRDVLGVRPHMLVVVLHVVVDEEIASDANLPFVFHAEGGGGGYSTQSHQDFVDSFEANLGLLEKGLELPPEASDAASKGAQAAVARLREFVSLQTKIHADRDLGDKRRKGALGSHNASEVRWPLHYVAKHHAEVRFAPLAIGWMQEKGVMTASEYAQQAASGRVTGMSKDVAVSLQKPAAALLQLPLCPHLVDSKGIVLSVPPLSNGWETRTTADAHGTLLLECSSAESETSCRRMLMELIRETIALVEGSPSCDSGEFLRQRKVRVLLEPVDVVCDWDRNKKRSEFPTYDELLSLPALPDYCRSPGAAEQNAREEIDDSD